MLAVAIIVMVCLVSIYDTASAEEIPQVACVTYRVEIRNGEKILVPVYRHEDCHWKFDKQIDQNRVETKFAA